MKIIIVGGGLAGLCLAEQFRQLGVDFSLVNNPQTPSSTAIATGMYNPVVFRRINPSWMIDELLPVMHAFFSRIEDRLGVKLIEPISFEKRIPSDDYAGLWLKRLNDPSLRSYLSEIINGFGPVQQAGILDCALFQKKMLDELKQESKLIEAAFDFDSINLDSEIVYQGESYDLIVSCEGPYATENPYFKWLPFNLCQGEWIIIQSEEGLTERVINNKTNIIPLGEGRYKLSSTYSWQNLDWKPSDDAAEELTAAFEELFDADYEIIERAAALRPTVADRRPYLGRHPNFRRLAIFNGLGSKGVMLAPYFSEQLANHLLNDEPLLPDVDITRHEKRLRRDL